MSVHTNAPVTEESLTEKNIYIYSHTVNVSHPSEGDEEIISPFY